MSENLWPDFDIGPAFRSPRAIISEAGAGVREKTRGLVTFYANPVHIKDNDVEAPFDLLCIPLAYSFPFMRAIFRVDAAYPVKLVAHRMPDIVANDESELIAALATIFKAPSTVETIKRLMSLMQ